MEKELFDQIKNDLQERVDACKDYYVESTEDIKNLSLRAIVALRDFAKKEYDDMTTIAMVDLYHIIGMGELTVTQMNTFLRLMREYLSYRPFITAISHQLVDFDNLPNIPARTKFRTLRLAKGTELTSGPEEGDEVEDTGSVQEYEQIKIARRTAAELTPESQPEKTKPKLPFEFKDNYTIYFPNENLKDVISFLKIRGIKLTEAGVKGAAVIGGKVDGTKWSLNGDQTYLVGRAHTDRTKSMFQSIYDKLKINKGVD